MRLNEEMTAGGEYDFSNIGSIESRKLLFALAHNMAHYLNTHDRSYLDDSERRLAPYKRTEHNL